MKPDQNENSWWYRAFVNRILPPQLEIGKFSLCWYSMWDAEWGLWCYWGRKTIFKVERKTAEELSHGRP